MTDKIRVVFVSGAYRSGTEAGVYANIQHARDVAEELWYRGYIAICPHTNSAHMGGLIPDAEWLERYLVLLRRCDAVVMLTGWEQSEGARAEYQEARNRGMTVWFESKELTERGLK